MIQKLQPDIDQLCVNTIRTLSIDAIQKANSGHPGPPLDIAPAAYTLWQRVLRYDPQEPNWLNRDRFVLSGGHASMLLYSLIHLSGIKAANASYETVGCEAVTKEFFGFSPEETFVVPPGVREHFATTLGARGARLHKAW